MKIDPICVRVECSAINVIVPVVEQTNFTYGVIADFVKGRCGIFGGGQLYSALGIGKKILGTAHIFEDTSLLITGS